MRGSGEPKSSKMEPKSITNLLQIYKNEALEACGGILGAFGAPGRFLERSGLEDFGFYVVVI